MYEIIIRLLDLEIYLNPLNSLHVRTDIQLLLIQY